MDRIAHPIEQEEVMAYLDGELPVDRASTVAAHLDHCEECRALVADLRSLTRRLADWQVEPAPAGLSARIRLAVQQTAPKAATPLAVPFSGTKPPSRRSPAFRWAFGLAAAFGTLALLVAIAIPNLLRTRMAGPQATRPGNPPAQVDMGPVPPSGGSGGGGDATPSLQVPAGPMIVKTASLTMVTRDFDSTRAAIEALIRQYRGTIAQMNVTSYRGTGHNLAATFRVPADQLEVLLADLKKLGRVEHESQSGEEVTQQYVDLVARLSNARRTEQRLTDILHNRTGTVTDVLSVEREIARVRGEIERLEAERQVLQNRVALATIQLQLNEEYRAELEPAPPSAPTRLRNAVVDGYHNFTEGALDLLLFLLRYGPSLAFWVFVLGWPLRAGWRRLQASKQ